MFGKSKKVKSKEGEESVWDYPRPPKMEKATKHLKIFHGKHTIADTIRPFRILETSHPPVYYFPPENVSMQFLKENNYTTRCEWKGEAKYYDMEIDGKLIKNVAWTYPNINKRYKEMEDYIAFYPGKFAACYVNGEPVQAQQGDFYGGWITSEIVGPFKGPPGTWGW